MTKILVNIWAYEHHAKFIVECEDNPASLEKAILDKLGEKSIVWENLGNSYRVSKIFPNYTFFSQLVKYSFF